MKMLNKKFDCTCTKLWQWCRLLFATFGILLFATFSLTSFSEKSIYFLVFIFDTRTNVIFCLITFIGVLFILYKLKDIILSSIGFFKSLCILLISAFFSLFSLLSVYFDARYDVNIINLLRSPASLMAFVAAFCGGIIFFFIAIRLIWHLGEHFLEIKLSDNNLLSRFFGKHLYRNCIILIALCWLPQYLIRFPGVVSYDAWQSIAMHLGNTQITTQHPLIWGALLGYLTQLGELIGITWLAPLVICLVQHILSILVITYAIASLKHFNFNSWVLGVTLAFFIILPPMALYASTLYNDCLYSLSIMLLTIELVYYLYDRKDYFGRRRHLILTVCAVFGFNLRYNGLYTMLAIIAVIALRELYLLIKRRTKIMQTLVIVVLCMILPLMCGQILQNTLNNAFDAKEIRSRAILSMPIQQSVRCLITYGDTIDKEDYDALHTVLIWTDKEYAEAYDPRNFDSVKESFKIDASKEEMSQFIKAWGRLVLKYPKTCFMASAHQTYYLFSPLVDNIRYYENITAHTNIAMEKYNFDATPYTLDIPVLKLLCKALIFFETKLFPQIPVLGMMVNPAIYTILLFAICLAGIFRKDKRVLVLTVMLLVTLVITFLGPAVYDHPRYIYPIMFSMPILLAAFVMPQKKSN